MDWLSNETIIVGVLGFLGILWSSLMKRETLSTQIIRNATSVSEASANLVEQLHEEIERLNIIITEQEARIKMLEGGDVVK